MYVKSDQFYTCQVHVLYERQLFKNKGLCDIGMEFDSPIMHESPEYIENSKLIPYENLVVLWNSNETYVYSVPKTSGKQVKRLYIYNKISRR